MTSHVQLQPQLQPQASASTDSTWRKWLRRLREFEEATLLTDQDIVGWRMDAIERELAELRARLKALTDASAESDGARR